MEPVSSQIAMCQLEPYPLLALLRALREIWLAQSSVLPFSSPLFRAGSAAPLLLLPPTSSIHRRQEVPSGGYGHASEVEKKRALFVMTY